MTVQNLHVIYASRSFTTSFAISFIDATHQTFIITEYGDTWDCLLGASSFSNWSKFGARAHTYVWGENNKKATALSSCVITLALLHMSSSLGFDKKRNSVREEGRSVDVLNSPVCSSALIFACSRVCVCVAEGGRGGDDFWQIETKSEDECILHLHYANASFFVLLNGCLRGTRLACNSRCNDNQFARWPDSSAILRGCRCHCRGWRTDARERREGARRGKETGGKKMGPDLCYTGETLNICLCVQRCSWEKQIHMRACNHPHTCSHNTARKAILLYHKLCT